MTESELTKIFKAIYNSPDLSGTAAKFLFGIQYVDELKNMSTKRLARMEERATGRPATALEIRKGKAIAPYVQVNDKSRAAIEEAIKGLEEKQSDAQSDAQPESAAQDDIVDLDKEMK